jgi:hypothetical protein
VESGGAAALDTEGWPHAEENSRPCQKYFLESLRPQAEQAASSEPLDSSRQKRSADNLSAGVIRGSFGILALSLVAFVLDSFLVSDHKGIPKVFCTRPLASPVRQLGAGLLSRFAAEGQPYGW